MNPIVGCSFSFRECTMPLSGFLLIDKPKGWTSFDVVNYVRSIAARVENKKPRQVKVGHTGTLDPAATGLLVLCIGTYTKKVTTLIRHDKTYEAEVTFGATSTTGDGEGTIEQRAKSKEQSERQIKDVLEQFKGEIEQTPPKYSALKVNGKRAYELARQGKEVVLQPRTITIYELNLLAYEWPIARVHARVSSGTYIRTLAEDIGESLQVGAYLSGLRRTTVGEWDVTNSVGPKSITIDNIRDKLLA